MTPEVRNWLMRWKVKGAPPSVEVADLSDVPEEVFNYINDHLVVWSTVSGEAVGIRRVGPYKLHGGQYGVAWRDPVNEEIREYEILGGHLKGDKAAGRDDYYTWSEVKKRVFWELQE